jgi:sulfide:quinone oxidoreductase
MTDRPLGAARWKQTVLILGGGTGGLVAASRLRRMLDKEHRVVIVDRSPFYTFQPSLSWVMLGERQLGRITRDLRALERKGIEFQAGEVKAIDAAGKRVLVNEEEVTFDYLVIAMGVDYLADDVPGLNRAWTYYHPEGAEGLREELPKFRSGRIVVAAATLPYRCPPSLYEGAFLIDHRMRERGIRDEVDIHVYTPEQSPLTEAGAAVGERLLHLLKERDIGFTGGAHMKSVNHQKQEINFADGGKAQFNMLVATPIHKAPYPLGPSGLLGDDGWVAVERDQLHTGAEDVYAIGDCVSIPIATGYLPKTGVFAHGQAEVVARNIVAVISGKEPIWAFGGQGACFMETGGGKGAYIVGNYYHEPPAVKFHGPSRFRHWMRIGFERLWLWRWF